MREDFLLSHNKSVQEFLEKKLQTEILLENQMATLSDFSYVHTC